MLPKAVSSYMNWIPETAEIHNFSRIKKITVWSCSSFPFCTARHGHKNLYLYFDFFSFLVWHLIQLWFYSWYSFLSDFIYLFDSLFVYSLANKVTWLLAFRLATPSLKSRWRPGEPLQEEQKPPDLPNWFLWKVWLNDWLYEIVYIQVSIRTAPLADTT
jgi:hypothetical protein